MIQSLKAIDDLDAFVGGYGLIVIDECHHLPAFSFEAAVRHASARHFLGLTATPYRRDGLQEIVTMQCGPIRQRIASSDSPAGEISLELIVRETGLAFAGAAEQPIHEVFRLLVEDKQRTTLVCDDVLAALAEGRRCLVLSQWKQHCHALAKRLQSRDISPLILEGVWENAHAPPYSTRSRTRPAAIRSSSSPPASTLAKASTARNSTPSSSPSPSPSRAASSGTPVASCEPTRGKRASASTTTPTLECRYYGPCTRDA
jgi:superfamily II DNA or RNA helicase